MLFRLFKKINLHPLILESGMKMSCENIPSSTAKKTDQNYAFETLGML
ncbi:MAG: hypothetical protein ABI441_09265 [Flavobacterium sp.]